MQLLACPWNFSDLKIILLLNNLGTCTCKENSFKIEPKTQPRSKGWPSTPWLPIKIDSRKPAVRQTSWMIRSFSKTTIFLPEKSRAQGCNNTTWSWVPFRGSSPYWPIRSAPSCELRMTWSPSSKKICINPPSTAIRARHPPLIFPR